MEKWGIRSNEYTVADKLSICHTGAPASVVWSWLLTGHYIAVLLKGCGEEFQCVGS
jgi:hypothetical protein